MITVRNHYIANRHKTSMLSLLALFIIADQLLLPVPRLFGHSLFKPSYWILSAWPLYLFAFGNKSLLIIGWKKRFFKITGPIILMLAFGLLGQLVLSTIGPISDQGEVIRASLFYTLMILSFGFGQSVPNFNYRWLLWLLYTIIGLVFLLTFAIDKYPLLIRLYYYTPENIDRMLMGASFRIRGLANPNSTMLLVNIMFLFLVVALRSGYLEKLRQVHIILIPILTIVVGVILGSRNQLIASIILIIFLIGTTSQRLIKKIAVISILLFAILLVASYLLEHYRNTYSFIDWTFNRIIETSIFDTSSGNNSETIYRPFIHWENFIDRFLKSPILGSGYSILSKYPFNVLPNYHNDWFRVFASSGLIGGVAFLTWMIRILKEYGYLTILPFFLPGLTNTFLRHTPSVIIYCFMLGVIIEQQYRTVDKNNSFN
jgi:O-antigen ligase